MHGGGRTDDVHGEVAGDGRVIGRVADDLVPPGHELRAAVDRADVTQTTTARTDEHRRRPRHVTRPPQ